MGSGTQIAKQASGIIIMDDNFNSIIKAIVWGRSIYQSIRKFLQFQMTVNMTALIATFVASITSQMPSDWFGGQSSEKIGLPLTAMQYAN